MAIFASKLEPRLAQTETLPIAFSELLPIQLYRSSGFRDIRWELLRGYGKVVSGVTSDSLDVQNQLEGQATALRERKSCLELA